MTTYIFTPPYVEEGPTSTNHRLFYFFKLRVGVSIAKVGSTYFQTRYPAQDDIDTYAEFYHGAHEHTGISEATKAALIAGGIGVTNTNFKAE
jgi:hypothetical protein